MSNHHGPEGCPPDEFRCEALVKASPHGWAWMKKDRRCARRAQQSRGGLAVCAVHAKVKQVTPWSETAT